MGGLRRRQSLADVLRWRLNALMCDYWTPAHRAVEHEDAETLARWLADGSDPEAF